MFFATVLRTRAFLALASAKSCEDCPVWGHGVALMQGFTEAWQRRTKFGEYRNIQVQVSKRTPEEVCLLLCFLWQSVIECAVFFLTPTA